MAMTNCPMCLGPVASVGNEPAKVCPHCGADLTGWKFNQAKMPALPVCPMCQRVVPLEANEPAKTCPNCGADLSRRMPRTPKLSGAPPEVKSGFNSGLGILGAVLGAGLGAGAVFGLHQWAGLHFPLLGVGVGVLTGVGARVLNRRTGIALGVISGVIALLAVGGTLHFLYATFPAMAVVAVIVGAGLAWWIAS